MTWSFGALKAWARVGVTRVDSESTPPKSDLESDGFQATIDLPPTRADLVAAGLLRDEATPDRSGVVDDPPLVGSLADRRGRRL
jgi:hypothetical protein